LELRKKRKKRMFTFEGALLDFGDVIPGKVELLHFREECEGTLLDASDLLRLDRVKVHLLYVLGAVRDSPIHHSASTCLDARAVF
jgi:hypothetical protein